MGLMIDGKYHAEDPKPDTDADGEFKRKKSTIRNWITTDGAPGPTGTGGFGIDQTRYHLFAAWNCPWAHRTLLARVIKNLDAYISISVAAPRRTDQGWVFTDPAIGSVASASDVLERDHGDVHVLRPVVGDFEHRQVVGLG